MAVAIFALCAGAPLFLRIIFLRPRRASMATTAIQIVRRRLLTHAGLSGEARRPRSCTSASATERSNRWTSTRSSARCSAVPMG